MEQRLQIGADLQAEKSGEPSVMLYGGKTSTISVAIYTEVVRNSFGTAAALASILTVSTVISLLIFLKVSKGRVSVV